MVRELPAAKQKDRLPALHARLVEAYRARCPDGWHTGPDDGYFFQHLPYHLAEAGRADERRALLFDYRWLRRKLEVAGVNRLIEDLEPLRDDAEARMLAGALRLSAHVLNHQPRQLAGQLLGRLSSADGPAIGALLGAARTGADRPSLAPLRRSLTPPGGPLLATLEGHGDWVRAVAVTPDGRRAVSGSDDRTLKVWDLEQGALLSTLEGHGAGVSGGGGDAGRAARGLGLVRPDAQGLGPGAGRAAGDPGGPWRLGSVAVAVTPDGRRAVSGSDDRTLKVWDLEQGALLATLEGHGAGVSGGGGDAGRAARGLGLCTIGRSRSGTWSRARCWRPWRAMALQVLAVAVTPDGRRAVSGSDDRTLKVWDLEQGALLSTLEGHGDGVWAVAVTPDGRRAVSGSDDRTLKVWDLEQGALLATLEGHGAWGHGGGGDAGRAARGLGLCRPDAQGLGPGAGRAAGDPGGPWRCGQGGGGDAGRAARGLGLRRPDAQGLGPGAGRAAGDPGGPWRWGQGGGGDAGRAARGLGLATTGRSRSGTWSRARCWRPWRAMAMRSGRWR